jgi:hypothetical protein
LAAAAGREGPGAAGDDYRHGAALTVKTGLRGEPWRGFGDDDGIERRAMTGLEAVLLFYFGVFHSPPAGSLGLDRSRA